MFGELAKNFGALYDIAKTSGGLFSLLLVFISGLVSGFIIYQGLHHSEIGELQLKEERLRAQVGKEELNSMQIRLLAEVWKLQLSTDENKVVVAKDGEVFSDKLKASVGINLIRSVMGTEPSGQAKIEFENLILSFSKNDLSIIPETRFASPFVLRVTEEGRKKIRS